MNAASTMNVIEVTEEFDGMMLLDFLCQHLPEVSVRQLRQMVSQADIRVGGVESRPDATLHAGDVVELNIPEVGLRLYRPERLPLTVLYEDRCVLVVDKPAGLAVLPDRRGGEPRFVNGLMYYLSKSSQEATGVARPLIAHRLDRDASGAIVVVKDRAALRSLSEQFARRTVQKEYLALVWGRVGPASGTIDAPLMVDRQAISVRVDRAGGSVAITHYAVEEQFRQVALVRVKPETGRLHQIRVHFRAIGHPVLCDPLYGDGSPLNLSSFKREYRASRDRPEPPLMTRLALHAERLSFVSPYGGRPVSVQAPIPKDLAVTLKMLRKYAVVQKRDSRV